MLRSKSLIGIEVISLKDGRKFGRVKDLLYIPGSKSIMGFMLDGTGCTSRKKVLPVKAIKSLGSSILIKNCDELFDLKRLKVLSKKELELEKLFGRKMITDLGDQLGIIDDVIIDEKDFSVRGFVLTDGIIEDILNGKTIIPYDPFIKFGEDAVIVKGEKLMLKNDISLKKLFRRAGAENNK